MGLYAKFRHLRQDAKYGFEPLAYVFRIGSARGRMITPGCTEVTSLPHCPAFVVVGDTIFWCSVRSLGRKILEEGMVPPPVLCSKAPRTEKPEWLQSTRSVKELTHV